MSAVVNSIVTKVTSLTNAATYWAKVGGELAKQVYKAEGLKPPSGKEFETVYQQAVKLIKTPAEQQKLFNQVKDIKPTKETAYKAGIYGIQLLAFFSVGEVIGRRSLTPISVGH
ncbi:ATP synthase subunit g, mitochondrial [Candida viswanathii]|uniref:ATP synthase subunit g, mitochondrial n=1 Tax=Candida viswanathii TaxID=5486 RepID=A0A367YD07_9ASCO|nr:ATP synthase subunit g, mitochondrial [Candida viswanathii]